MSMYPDFPNNRLIVSGVDITVRFNMILEDGYVQSPPEPKTYIVDIPGGDSGIDLTEALTGDVSFNNREEEYTFDVIDMQEESTFEQIKTKVSNFLNGRSYEYTKTFDPGYTYKGRFTVEESSHESYSTGLLGKIKIKISSEPYKLKQHCKYTLNPTGGKLFALPSGRKKVHPVLTCSETCFVTFNQKNTIVPAGTSKLNNVLFSEGYNEIYINSRKLYSLVWDDLASTGDHPMTWDEMSKHRWDEIGTLGYDHPDAPRCWDDLGDQNWDSLSSKYWNDLDYSTAEIPSVPVTIEYDWKDL